MRSPFTTSRAMAMQLALESMDDEVKRSSHRTRRRVRRTRGMGADDRRG
jgi:hypothetical protein